MGRKKRLVEKTGNVKYESTSIGGTETVHNSSDHEDEDDVQITIESLLYLQGTEKEYLRLKGIRGHLPLSFYCHVDFKNLRILNLRNCKISALHAQIANLKHLKHLDISGNDDIKLPAQLAKCNLTRFIYSPSLLKQRENHHLPYNTSLNKDYCGDRREDAIPRLSRLAAQTVIDLCSMDELDELRQCVPNHLRDHLLPNVCAECGSVGRAIVATRVRNAVIAFNTVPVHYSLCSPICLERIQATWKLEEILNNEKRALRMQKFGRTNAAEIMTGMVAQYAYA
ncbi:protein of unknown function [Taphrina deformans PYCC 5710]|uniref:Uncharacterized protein n=1 Tax=Taphrina deformans (strain PYCC 5710 / ATCC 11124 / CBS 356.35 / IMI 108563 / JCM 9778 / NBRC 8474) TaxID=1097556 RepID=R4X6B4_TAPDE|nr:protein of unknown function [Taphrina deformans PYCC 5710]|eukprot:CCG80574.1 protein of unknown function [Taphrina deformans PYCC 5710]